MLLIISGIIMQTRKSNACLTVYTPYKYSKNVGLLSHPLADTLTPGFIRPYIASILRREKPGISPKSDSSSISTHPPAMLSSLSWPDVLGIVKLSPRVPKSEPPSEDAYREDVVEKVLINSFSFSDKDRSDISGMGVMVVSPSTE